MAPMTKKQRKQLNSLNPQQIRNMLIWEQQLMAAMKRALKEPGILHETVLDIGPGREVWLQIKAEERTKLIVPEDCHFGDGDA